VYTLGTMPGYDGLRSAHMMTLVSADAYHSVLDDRVNEVQKCRPTTTWCSATCIGKAIRAYANMQDQEILSKKVRGLGGKSCK